MFRVKVIPLLSSHSGWSVYTLLSVERQVNQYTHTHSFTHSLTLSVFITLSLSLSGVNKGRRYLSVEFLGLLRCCFHMSQLMTLLLFPRHLPVD